MDKTMSYAYILSMSEGDAIAIFDVEIPDPECYADDNGYLSCVRAPPFDTYRSVSEIPLSTLIEDGWLLECFCGCGTVLGEINEGDEVGDTHDLNAYVGTFYRPFVCQLHLDHYETSVAAINAKRQAFRDQVATRYPFLELAPAYRVPFAEPYVEFTFPGARHGRGLIRPNPDEGASVFSVSVPQGDRAAFHAFLETVEQKPAATAQQPSMYSPSHLEQNN